MSCPKRLPFVIRACAISLLLFVGCQERVQRRSPGRPIASAISTDDLLDRCVAAYAHVRTLRAGGVFRDNRQGDRRTRPIRWDFERPDKCRLQIDANVAIVAENACWNYDPVYHNFKRARVLTRTPMETAGYLLSRGVSFMLPAVLERDEAAFGRSRVRGYVDWRLSGVAWLDEHPCYVVCKTETVSLQNAMRRIWIDQDSYLLRAWDLVEPDQNGRDNVIVAETFHELAVNIELPADLFNVAISPPIENNATNHQEDLPDAAQQP